MHEMPIRWAYYCIFRAANAPDLGNTELKITRIAKASSLLVDRNLNIRITLRTAPIILYAENPARAKKVAARSFNHH